MLTRSKFAVFTTAIVLALGIWYSHARGDPNNYAATIRNVLVSEGGSVYTNHPSDPGGPTKYGITIWDVRAYLDKNATADRVKRLTEAEALVIYRLHYWEALNGDALPKGLDYSVVDYGVNSGVSRSGKVLRRLLGLSDKDWHVTPEVLARLRMENPQDLINAINNERMRFLQALHTYPIFGRGWSNRVHSVRLISLQMANPAIGSELGSADFIPRVGLHKAYEEEGMVVE